MTTVVMTRNEEVAEVARDVFERLHSIGDLFVHELLTPEECELLGDLQYRTVRFAFANLSCENNEIQKDILKTAIINRFHH